MERYWLYGITAESYKWCMKWEIPAQSTELNLCYLLWKSAQLQAEKLTQSRSYRLRKPKPTLSIFSPLCTWDKPGHGVVGEGRHAKLIAQQRCVGGWVRNFCACTSVRRRGGCFTAAVSLIPPTHGHPTQARYFCSCLQWEWGYALWCESIPAAFCGRALPRWGETWSWLKVSTWPLLKLLYILVCVHIYIHTLYFSVKAPRIQPLGKVGARRSKNVNLKRFSDLPLLRQIFFFFKLYFRSVSGRFLLVNCLSTGEASHCSCWAAGGCRALLAGAVQHGAAPAPAEWSV